MCMISKSDRTVFGTVLVPGGGLLQGDMVLKIGWDASWRNFLIGAADCMYAFKKTDFLFC